MFKKLKLRNRIFLGYSLPMVALLGSASLGLFTANHVLDTFKEAERVEQVLKQSHQVELATLGMSRGLRGYLVLQDQDILEEYEEAIKLFSKSVDPLKNTDILHLESQKNLLQQIIQIQENYTAKTNKIIGLARQGRQTEAINLFQALKEENIENEFIRLDLEFDKVEQDLLDQDLKKAEAALGTLIWVLLIGTLGLGSLGMAAALWISLGVTKTINQASNTIASSSSEIAATMEQQERTASQQATSVSETTTTMNEMEASSRQSAEQASVAANAAQQALQLADGGTEAVKATLKGMSDLEEKVGAIANQSMRLSEQTTEIGNISQLVSEIANQTNMLALNAAVEAVRAGENGKGFSVVAGEIRKLADQSKQSAEKINLLVSQIQNQINSTVMVTDEGTKTVKTGVQIAQNTEQAFTGVADAVKNVVLNNQQISLTLKQQVDAIQQVVGAMNNINQGAQQTASGITQTRAGTQKLNEATLELKAIV